MRTLTPKYHGGQSVEENCYKADLAVLDRYQAFSSEIVRLALLGIAGYGFLISNVVLRGTSGNPTAFSDRFFDHPKLLAAGLAFLALSTCTALAHRYFSTDCMTHFIRRLRLVHNRSSLVLTDRTTLEADILEEESSLQRDIWRCQRLLMTATVSLGIGMSATGLAFAFTLFPPVVS